MLAGYFLIGRRAPILATLWLGGASLFFYGWWDPTYVGLLLGSIAFNFTMGTLLARWSAAPAPGRATALACFAITANLALLGYYKYANFLVGSVAGMTGLDLTMATLVLPLGISFFTFTQIAFLVDAYQGKAREYSFPHYLLFVTYFPHLIAGPVLHHKEMMPQFRNRRAFVPQPRLMAVGAAIFAVGLVKKTVFADAVGPYADAVFNGALAGAEPTLFEAWLGALAYTCQIYFDFSAYSDMAIGLSLLFGIWLPINFNSPYKAANIIDFWRRWHMTLSRFLRDYLYIPLGGGRRGPTRRFVNLFLTMLLGGLWHGAGWTFVLWGMLHGLYLIINHGWQTLTRHRGPSGMIGRLAGRALTFVAVVVAWVLFRAESVDAASSMLAAMFGANGLSLPAGVAARLLAQVPQLNGLVLAQGPFFNDFADWVRGGAWIAVLLAIAWTLPNSQQLAIRFRPAIHETVGGYDACRGRRPWFRPSVAQGVLVGILLAVGVVALSGQSAFLYFQF